MELVGDLGGVVVVEMLGAASVLEPDAYGDSEPQALCLVELRPDVIRTPEAKGVPAGFFQELSRSVATGALDEKGLAFAEDRPAVVGLGELDV